MINAYDIAQRLQENLGEEWAVEIHSENPPAVSASLQFYVSIEMDADNMTSYEQFDQEVKGSRVELAAFIEEEADRLRSGV
jgi:hypothetical protein